MTSQNPKNGPFKEFDLLDWFRDGCQSFLHDVETTTDSLDRSEVRSRMRNAIKEQLILVRDTIDDMIEQIDARDAEAA